jgi:hypothetical protein
MWLATLFAAYIYGTARTPVDVPEAAKPVVQKVEPAAENKPAARVVGDAEIPPKETEAAEDKTASERPKVTIKDVATDASAGETLTRGELGLAFSRTLTENDPIKRSLEFARLLQQVDSANIHDVIAAFEDLPEGYDRNRERQLLMYQWGTFDGAAAMEYMADERSWYMEKFNALSGWSTVDADGALAWARANHEGNDNPYLIGIVNGIAKTDPVRASQIAETMEYGRNRGYAASILVNAFMRQGPDEAKSWAPTVADERLRDGVVSMVARELARTNPADAAAWVGSLENVDATRSVERIAEQWSRTDPVAAAEWVGTVANVDAGPAIEQIAEQWGRTDPASAAKWVASQESQDVRTESLEEVISAWARTDVAAAGEYLRNYPASPERDEAIERYARHLSYTDNKEAAIEWANAISDEESRKRELERIERGDRWRGRGRGGGGGR